MSDRPDYTLPVSIEGYTIVSLPIDIKAQSVGNIGIDIKAQTLGNININIAASAATLNVNLSASAITLNVNITNAAITVTGSIIITSGTITFTNTSIAVTGTVAISGSVTVTGAVTVTGSVTISGPVTVTSGAVTISTAAGTNIILDLLTQSAYTERRSALSNHGATESWTQANGNYYAIKYFPRGCRGFIKSISVNCYDAGAAGGTLTLYLANYVGSGIVMQGTITIPASGAPNWRVLTMNKQWNYDSLCIIIHSSTADMRFAYDSGTSPDYFESSDAMATWVSANYRLWIDVTMEGESCGDVPVSGTVNNIEIPKQCSSRSQQTLVIDASAEGLDTLQVGSGKLLIAYFHGAAVGSINLVPRIYCDGVKILPADVSFYYWYSQYIQLGQSDIYFGQHDSTALQYTMVVRIPYPFKRSLQIGIYNADVAQQTCDVSYSYEKIS